MSSFKNAMKTQKVHRERHQNEARAKLGPLEKKKDYKVRANDQHKKKKFLKTLAKKALLRNPDEFHFHMHNSQVEDGRHQEKTVIVETSESDLRTDLDYVRGRRTREQKKIEKLRASLHFLESYEDEEMEEDGEKTTNTHFLFVDTPEEARTKTAAELLDTHPALVKRKFNRLRNDQLKDLPDSLAYSLQNSKEAEIHKSKAYKELCKRVERDNKLKVIEEKLVVKVALLKHKKQNEKRTIKHPEPVCVKQGTEKEAPVYKWPKIRKK